MITIDNTAASAAQANVTSFTWNHTVGTGTGTVLVIMVSGYDAAFAPTVSSATFNSVALTQAKNIQYNNQILAEVWYLVNPSVGTHTVSVSLGGGTVDEVGGGSVSIFGASGKIGGTNTQGVNGSISYNVTTQVNSLVVDAVFSAQQPITKGASQTQIYQTNISGDTTAGSYQPTTGTTTTTAWSCSGLSAGASAEFLPANSGFFLVL